jgi:hypothetical protein
MMLTRFEQTLWKQRMTPSLSLTRIVMGTLIDHAKPRIRRYAVYTRKTSDEGLERDFDSLHALREVCEAFIKTQTRGLETHYVRLRRGWTIGRSSVCGPAGWAQTTGTPAPPFQMEFPGGIGNKSGLAPSLPVFAQPAGLTLAFPSHRNHGSLRK